MNTLEKAQLLEELDTLIDALDRRALTLFETAKYKQRIRDIFELCDEPCFHRQLLQYRSLTQPDVAVEQFLKTTAYQLTYRGFFYHDYDLEHALYQWPDSGWALLYHQFKGWQLWFIPAKNRTALISDWGILHDVYQWLEEQLESYPNLMSDEQLRQNVVILEHEVRPVSTALNVTSSPRLSSSGPNQSPPNLSSLQEYKSSSLKPIDFLGQQLRPEQSLLITEEAYVRVHLDNTHFIEEYIDIYVAQGTQSLSDQPIFIAEQRQPQGGFYKYVLWLGFHDAEQLLNLLPTWQEMNLHFSAIKRCNVEIIQHWEHLETLYQYYQQLNDVVWQQEELFPCIPRSLIHAQKIIHFEETHAQLHTPVLLLQERGHLRLIHGQRRLQLRSHDLAIPCIIFEREQGLTWQQIQQVVNLVRHPVDALELHALLLQELT